MAGRTVAANKQHHLASNLAGKRFGHVIAMSPTDERYCRYVVWTCQCDCGASFTVSSGRLTNGTVTNCGCIRRAHAQTVRTNEYQLWRSMIKRCRNAHLLRYGGRGIRICDRWLKYEHFINDMGPRPSMQHSIDRINNDGDYEPGNCRWATWSQQHRNTSRSKHLTFNGETLPLLEWCQRTGLTEKALRSRIDHGWSVDRALTTPTQKRMRHARTS